ncbi:terminase [Defluviimonas sp. 20V17]|uniref:Terminase n=1 Tax=Allgaiera indica TaxID=765699 RepID=A0AAN4UQL1_9RHOB|nr:phage terminase small subunit P27 family [Allgaiera indica]KDB03144.1 terminase [Defluviimonas sp. 20V17]GHE00912.1 terminase [Allgaiera indica]SDW74363.1 phage terminase, small subunit, putative, P27 family [Allgaiera indica]
MMRGRKPKPTAIRLIDGNPGKRGYNADEPVAPEGEIDCPPHLSDVATEEWRRIAGALQDMGVVTLVDRAALAAYCQSYGRWVEAEEKLKETPTLVKTASGYIQQNPWLTVANKQLELMGRYMGELGITPASRSRVAAFQKDAGPQVTTIRIIGGLPQDGDAGTIDASDIDLL